MLIEVISTHTRVHWVIHTKFILKASMSYHNTIIVKYAFPSSLSKCLAITHSIVDVVLTWLSSLLRLRLLLTAYLAESENSPPIVAYIMKDEVNIIDYLVLAS